MYVVSKLMHYSRARYPNIVNTLETLPKFYRKRSNLHIHIGESIKNTHVVAYSILYGV